MHPLRGCESPNQLDQFYCLLFRALLPRKPVDITDLPNTRYDFPNPGNDQASEGDLLRNSLRLRRKVFYGPLAAADMKISSMLPDGMPPIYFTSDEATSQTRLFHHFNS